MGFSLIRKKIITGVLSDRSGPDRKRDVMAGGGHDIKGRGY